VGTGPVRVLIVDESPASREAIARAVASAPGVLEVVGTAASGTDALSQLSRQRPDIVTLSVRLGHEDGLTLVSRIMATQPVPVLVVAALDGGDPALAFRAVEAGAVDVLPRLPAPTHPAYERERRRLIRLLETLAKVPVVTRRHAPVIHKMQRSRPSAKQARLVAIGASTGGPPVIQQILAALPQPFPLPIAIVQHMAEGFGGDFASWLSSTTQNRVTVCDREVELLPGAVYLAPDDAHLVLTPALRLAPSGEDLHRLHRPSIDVLFASVAMRLGAGAVGVLLTGMGRDGAAGLATLERAGGVTIAQEPSTCIVDSMPTAAMAVGAASAVMTPEDIGGFLASLGAKLR
jgi:two-component system chemotaxis response regulator CheB